MAILDVVDKTKHMVYLGCSMSNVSCQIVVILQAKSEIGTKFHNRPVLLTEFVDIELEI